MYFVFCILNFQSMFFNINMNQLVIMVGDPKQLPATVFSNSAKRKRYDQSLFEVLL